MDSIDVLREEDLEGSLPVGLATSPEVVRLVEVNGETVDVLRVFALAQAQELASHLASVNIACLIAPVSLDFGDGLARFQVRVRAADRDAAEASFRDRWASEVAREGTGVDLAEIAVDRCPACDAEVPLEAEECPDCGLFVGSINTEDITDRDEALA